MEQIGLVVFYGITAFDDIRTKQVRTMELIIFALIGVILNVVNKDMNLLSALSAVAIGAILAIISTLTKGKLGMGDALIIAVSGLYLGFKNTLALVWLSSLMAAGYGILVLRKYDNKRNIELPFVPFLLLAYMLILIRQHIGGLLF